MIKESDKINDINVEIARLLETVKATHNYISVLRIRRLIREAFLGGLMVNVSLGRGVELRAYSYGELEFLDLKIDDVESIFCQKVVSCN